jgi:hypothetical protein
MSCVMSFRKGSIRVGIGARVLIIVMSHGCICMSMVS